VYSQGRSSKKNVIVIMSSVAISASVRVSPNVCTILKIIMIMGMGFTTWETLTIKVYATVGIFARVRGPQYGVRLINGVDVVLQGASSNVHSRRANLQSWYLSPKTWRMETGSAQALRYGSTLWTKHNVSQGDRCLSIACPLIWCAIQ
jgi:hypothetical protein